MIDVDLVLQTKFLLDYHDQCSHSYGSRGGSLVATPDCETAILGSNPAISPAYSGLSVLIWAAIRDGTSL